MDSTLDAIDANSLSSAVRRTAERVAETLTRSDRTERTTLLRDDGIRMKEIRADVAAQTAGAARARAALDEVARAALERALAHTTNILP